MAVAGFSLLALMWLCWLVAFTALILGQDRLWWRALVAEVAVGIVIAFGLLGVMVWRIIT